MTTLGVVMRFRNSAATLPAVLAALDAQSRRPDLIVGVDNASSDGSRELLAAHGARFVDWRQPYHVSKVLNAGIAACTTDLVLVLSSHTVLADRDALAQYEEAFADPLVAAVSHCTPACPLYSSRVDWDELCAKGMSRGSIYSNSSGCLRRSCWQQSPFDERIAFAAEDYDWIVGQLRLGRVCRMLPMTRDYLRRSTPPYIHLKTARMVHAIAARHGVRARTDDLREWTMAAWWVAKSLGCSRRAWRHWQAQWGWIAGRLTWRWHDPFAASPTPPDGTVACAANGNG